MKKIISLSFFLLSFVLIALAAHKMKMQPSAPPSSGVVINFPKGSKTFAIVPDKDTNKRLVAENLEDRYKKEGLKIEYTGNETAPPPNVRLVGTPFKIKMIRELN